MCQQIVQFCTGSTKALLSIGGLLSLLLALAIGYTGCTTNALYNDIDPEKASTQALAYYLQLAAAGYLTLITIFSCYAAYYDQKHSIRALAFVSMLNFIVALVAIMMVPSGQELGHMFEGTLKMALPKYNFTDKGLVEQKPSLAQLARQFSATDEATVMNSTVSAASTATVAADTSTTAATKQKRWAAADEVPAKAPVVVREMNGTDATRIWDRLQARGCCGMLNATEEWKAKVPKSCCSAPVLEGDEMRCKTIDAAHQLGCLTLIGSTSLSLLMVLTLIALVNFYLALITGISAYRTFHYDEAAQNAYT